MSKTDVDLDSFLTSIQEQIQPSMSSVRKYDNELKSMSLWWSKICLIGKINSLDVASNILEDMDQTLDQFNALKSRLIDNLAREFIKEDIDNDKTRCQMVIDVLIRNLFERTADIGFLSTDTKLVKFLNDYNEGSSDSLNMIRSHLHSYINIYTVYKNAVIIRPDGTVITDLEKNTSFSVANEDWFKTALDNPNIYVEIFDHTQLSKNNNKELFYAQAVVSNNRILGVIALVFRFNDEMSVIFNSIESVHDKNNFLLLDEHGNIIFRPSRSSSFNNVKVIRLHSLYQQTHIESNQMCIVSALGQPYQGYEGPKGWQACSLVSLHELSNESFISPSDIPKTSSQLPTSIIPDELLNISMHVSKINDALQLIVMNGIITASRERAVEFVPVLEAIKDIGHKIAGVFSKAIDSLFYSTTSTQLYSLQLKAMLAVDIMDRNLYERANDCRWWALNDTLRQSLSSDQINSSSDAIKHTLQTIHALYTVYHTLYIYDKSGKYIQFSCDRYDDLIGSYVEENSGYQGALSLHSIFEYSVSPFTEFNCCENKSTYIYNAPIRNINSEKEIIGGIGIVFNSEEEFYQILCDTVHEDHKDNSLISVALFTDENGFIISSTSSDFPIGSIFDPDINLTQLNDDKAISTIIEWNNKKLLLGVAKSQGYREYKRSDDYVNNIYAWVFMIM